MKKYLYTFIFLCLISSAFAAKQPNVAFYYGNNPPIKELQAFDIAVVDPDSPLDPKTFNNKQTEAYAYVSVGEITKQRAYYKDIPKAWIIGYNPAWNSYVVDQRNAEWRAFFLNRIIQPLWERGFRGFFLDTLDSFQLATKTKTERQQQSRALIQLINDFKDRFPQAKLFFNRGFEILPSVHQHVTAVAAESLFASWNPSQKRYQPVTTNEYQFLTKALDQLKSYDLPIVIIDYLPPKQRQQARQIAAKIRNLGYIPWVTDHDLKSLGIGNIEVLPRDVIVVFEDSNPSLMETQAFRTIAMPLENLGLVPHFYRTDEPLPQGILNGRYAGIVVWLNSNNANTSTKWQRWIEQQIDHGMRFAFFNHFGFTADNISLAPLGIKFAGDPDHIAQHARIVHQSDLFGYESQPLADPNSFLALHLTEGSPLLQVKDDSGKLSTMAALTPWGGYVLAPYALTVLPNDKTRWVIDPFHFLQRALALPVMPLPDVTTENGARLLITHIDGDGFVSRGEWYQGEFAGKVMDEEILKKYQLPTTVSIIQGEIAANGLYPKYHKALETIARNIFKHDWVEISTHTYSHPYNWLKIESSDSIAQQKGYNLPIPNYRFDLNTEITGSIAYINSHLAPPNKHCEVVLWSGNTDPSKNALALCEANQVKNFNGGDTTITKDNNSITNIAPLGVYKNSYYQVFAPNQNENMYTNLWQGPFWGYKRVIETFKLTDKPHRYKPMNIYYHFYSATKRASLEALHEVYQYAIAQPFLALYVSEYVDRVHDFLRMVIARDDARGGFVIRGNHRLRELRLPKSAGYPNFAKSSNVIGYRDYNQDRYMHLGTESNSHLNLTKQASSQPYLSLATSQILSYQIHPQTHDIEVRFKPYTLLRADFANTENCVILDNNSPIIEGNMDLKRLVLSHKETHVIRVTCRT